MSNEKRITKGMEQLTIDYNTPSDKETIAVWFSCGAASAVAAYETKKKYGDTHNILIVNNPVDEEDEDNRRFLKDVEKWLGQKIIISTSKKAGTTSARDIWEKQKYMSGVKGAPCTRDLKKHARYEFELENRIHWHVLGFTSDELTRHERFSTFERENTLPVLIEAGLTKQDCFRILEEAGIRLPKAYDYYPNANCIGCVKSSSPTYWNAVRKNNPVVFSDRAEQSRRIGVRLVTYKGKRIFLDELPEDAVGRKMKLKSPECGIFCGPPKGIKY